MANQLMNAVVIKTNLNVQVYSVSGGWCNYADCKTIYKAEDLKMKGEAKDA